jgi:hypothetical protein
MADLHNFKEKTSTPEGRSKPLPAQDLDDNFRVCRLKIAGPLSGFLKITDNFPQADELDFAFAVPTSGTYFLGFVNGAPTLFEKTEACP